MKPKKPHTELFFVSNAFKIIEAFKTTEEIKNNKEKLIERIDVSWTYSGKLINKLTERGYIKKTKKGRSKTISLTAQGKKLHKVLKDMRKLI